MAFTASSNSYQFTIAARDGTKAAFNSISTNVTKLSGGIAGLAAKTRAMAGPAALGLAGLGAAGALALGKIYSAAAENIDVLAKQASKIAETTEEVQAFNHAAQLSGVSLEASNKALVVMEKNLGDALDGIGTSADALERLGLNAEQVAALPPVTAYEMLSDELAQVESQTERVYLATQIFGRTGVDMINLTGDAVRSARTEIDELGISLSTVDATQVEAANDSFFKVSQAVEGFGNRLAVEFAPIFTAVSNEFLNMAKEAGGFGNIATRVFDATVKGAAYVANVIRGLSLVWDGMKVIVATGMEVVLTYFETIEKGMRAVLQYVPGVEISAEAALTGIRESVTATNTQMREDFMEALNAPMPYDSVVTWAENVKSQAEEAARSIALAKTGRAANDEGDSSDGDPEVIAAQQRISQLNFLKEAQLASEAEQEELALLQRAEFFQKNKELAAQYQIDLTQVSNAGYLERMKFERSSLKDQSKQVFGTLANITAGVANHNKGLFRLNQLAGIANATINTAEGVTKALSAYPPPLSFAMAAAQLAAGVAQISAIKSTKYGGGGSAGSVGGAPAVGATPITTAPSNYANQAAANEPKRPDIYIDVEPTDIFTGQQMRDMLERLSEEVGYGVKFGT